MSETKGSVSSKIRPVNLSDVVPALLGACNHRDKARTGVPGVILLLGEIANLTLNFCLSMVACQTADLAGNANKIPTTAKTALLAKWLWRPPQRAEDPRFDSHLQRGDFFPGRVVPVT